MTADEGPITITEAVRRVLAATPRLGFETVPVADALDRVLAERLTAAGDVPPFACSAMDGYAIVSGPAGRMLELAGESSAGSPSADPVPGPSYAIRISTGAAVPDGADAVVRQEDTELAPDGKVVTTAESPPGDNIRRVGEDLSAGATVLEAGTRLTAAGLGAAVSAGVATLPVAVRPRVAILSTGNELRAPGEPLGPGQIYSSNGVALTALAVRAGAVVTTTANVRDERTATEQAFGDAIAAGDVVVASGGVSVGPHDHVKPALAELGVEQRFWGVRLQPGKPTWFGIKGDKLVFGLPGNPVSAIITFALFVAPALAALQGAGMDGRAGIATLADDLARRKGRDQVIRVRLEQRDGRVYARSTGSQASHLITSLLAADALALIPAGDGSLPAGATVELLNLPR